jgi:GAF domain-containing protein
METALESQETVATVVPSVDQRNVSATLAVPMRVRGETIGVVHLSREGTETQWTRQERALVSALVEELGEVVESERQFADTRSTLAQTERMYEASQKIGVATTRREILGVVLEIASSTSIDQVAAFTFAAPVTHGLPKMQELSAVWDREKAAPLASVSLRHSVEELPFVYSMSKGRSLVVPDIGQADRLDPQLQQVLGERQFRAFAAVPMVAGDEWLGYTVVLVRRAHSFTPGELRVYESVNRQAAMALRSVQLYQEAEKRAQREELIREITSKMRGTPDLETILSTAVEELGKALGVSRAFVRLGAAGKVVRPEQEAHSEKKTSTADAESKA